LGWKSQNGSFAAKKREMNAQDEFFRNFASKISKKFILSIQKFFFATVGGDFTSKVWFSTQYSHY
jgi:hypothetical protein